MLGITAVLSPMGSRLAEGDEACLGGEEGYKAATCGACSSTEAGRLKGGQFSDVQADVVLGRIRPLVSWAPEPFGGRLGSP